MRLANSTLYCNYNRADSNTSNDTPGIPSAIDTASDNCDNGTSIPVSDDTIFNIASNTGPQNSDTKALLKGFLFLHKKCTTEKNKYDITATDNKTNIPIPQTKKDYRKTPIVNFMK